MATQHLTREEFSRRIADPAAAAREWRFLGQRPAVVDFYATWCGPCKALAPSFEELSEEFAGRIDFYKIDIDREPELAAAFGVRSVPTLLFIPLGKTPRMMTGALPKGALRETIEHELLTSAGK